MLLKRQKEHRNSVLIRIGIDGSGGFLKICMSIFDINNPFPCVQGGISRKLKESGVQKIFLLAVVPEVSENYVNVKKLWINLGQKIYHSNWPKVVQHSTRNDVTQQLPSVLLV